MSVQSIPGAAPPVAPPIAEPPGAEADGNRTGRPPGDVPGSATPGHSTSVTTTNPATTGEQLAGHRSLLDALLATTSLQGTAAIDIPEVAQQLALSQDPAARGSALDNAVRADAAFNGNRRDTGARATAVDAETATVIADRQTATGNAAQRSGADAADLVLPPGVAAAAAQITDQGLARPPQEPTPNDGVASLVVGQPQTTRLERRDDDPRTWRKRRDRDGRGRDPGVPELFDDDLPEHHARSGDELDRDGAGADHGVGVTDDTWAVALARRLMQEPSSSPGARALSEARAQWVRGRAVLVVCPSGTTNGDAGLALLVRAVDGGPAGVSSPGLATASIRWAMDATPSSDARLPLSLRGQSFAARLHWKLVEGRAPRTRWWAVRVAKQHGISLARQLRATREPDEEGKPATSASGLFTDGVTIQLGPVLVPHAREWDLRVRIDAVQRLWSDLQDQWSLLVVACNEPLVQTR